MKVAFWGSVKQLNAFKWWILRFPVLFLSRKEVIFTSRWKHFTFFCFIDKNLGCSFLFCGSSPFLLSPQYITKSKLFWGKQEKGEVIFPVFFPDNRKRSKLGSGLILSIYKRDHSSSLTFFDSIYKIFCI